MEIPGHGDILGRDAEDSHPITAITGLRGELDDHNARLVTLETVRIPALEARVTTLEDKVATLETKVADLETKMAELWPWYLAHKDDGEED